MPITLTTSSTNRFRKELPEAAHNIIVAGHDIRIGLFKAQAAGTGTYGKTTNIYTDVVADENDASGYIAKGESVTKVAMTEDDTNNVSWWGPTVSITWSAITMTSFGAFMFNDTHANDTVLSIHAFGVDKTSSGGDFVVQMPVAAFNTALLQFA